MALALVIIPLACAVLVAAVPSNRWRPWLLPLGSGLHMLLCLQAIRSSDVVSVAELAGARSGRQGLSRRHLRIALSLHAVRCQGYLNLRPERPNRVLCALLVDCAVDDDAGHPLAPPRPDVGGR